MPCFAFIIHIYEHTHACIMFEIMFYFDKDAKVIKTLIQTFNYVHLYSNYIYTSGYAPRGLQGHLMEGGN